MAFSPFSVTQVTFHPQSELFARIKEVTMLLDRTVKPYKEAHLSLRKMYYADLRPAQRYVLSDNLAKAQLLEWELKKHGYDLFDLNGYLTIRTDLSEEPMDLLPPVVEKTLEADGSHHNIVNDGMHRLYLGRLEFKLPSILYAEGVSKDHPYYAYPVPGPFPWDSVEILQGDSIPPGFVKKWHRIQDNKLLYRDFNSAFQNVGGPRGGGREK
jgi:hypothetical protein